MLIRRGSLLGTSIFVYAVTSPINGYFGGALYAKMGGRIWIRQMLLSAFLLPSLVCGMAFLINFIAIYYHASRAIPFGSMVSNNYSIIWKFIYNINNFLLILYVGCSSLHMCFCDITSHISWNITWSKFIWAT